MKHPTGRSDLYPQRLVARLCILFAASTWTAAVAADVVGATIYGKTNVSVARIDDGANDTWELTSNASRLGFKGSADLTGTLQAIYKLEYEVFFDDGDSGGNTFTQRNIYIGLQGRGGTLFAGKHDTAVKMAQLGVTDKEMGHILEMSPSSIRKHFQEELDYARSHLRKALRKSQLELAINDKNPTMLIWLGKNYLGQREPKAQMEHSGAVTVEKVLYGSD